MYDHEHRERTAASSSSSACASPPRPAHQPSIKGFLVDAGGSKDKTSASAAARASGAQDDLIDLTDEELQMIGLLE